MGETEKSLGVGLKQNLLLRGKGGSWVAVLVGVLKAGLRMKPLCLRRKQYTRLSIITSANTDRRRVHGYAVRANKLPH